VGDPRRRPLRLQKLICSPGPGLKTIFETIDNRTDFNSYMQNYAVARGTPRGPRREGPYEEGFVSLELLVYAEFHIAAPPGATRRESYRYISTDLASVHQLSASQWRTLGSRECTTFTSTLLRGVCPTIANECDVWCRSRRKPIQIKTSCADEGKVGWGLVGAHELGRGESR
jgi:hypothetical protein